MDEQIHIQDYKNTIRIQKLTTALAQKYIFILSEQSYNTRKTNDYFKKELELYLIEYLKQSDITWELFKSFLITSEEFINKIIELRKAEHVSLLAGYISCREYQFLLTEVFETYKENNDSSIAFEEQALKERQEQEEKQRKVREEIKRKEKEEKESLIAEAQLEEKITENDYVPSEDLKESIIRISDGFKGNIIRIETVLENAPKAVDYISVNRKTLVKIVNDLKLLL